MKLKSLFVCLLGSLALVAGMTAQAQSVLPDDYFAVSSATTCRQGGRFDTTNYWACIPQSDNGGHPVITLLSLRTDLAASAVRFFVPGTNVSVTITNASVPQPTNYFGVTSTNNKFVANDRLIIEHRNSGFKPKQFELAHVDSISGTVITLKSNLAAVVVAGDVVWKVQQQGQMISSYSTTGGTALAGTTNTVVSAQGFFAGERNKPVLVELNATATAGLDNVAGFYSK